MINRRHVWTNFQPREKKDRDRVDVLSIPASVKKTFTLGTKVLNLDWLSAPRFLLSALSKLSFQLFDQDHAMGRDAKCALQTRIKVGDCHGRG